MQAALRSARDAYLRLASTVGTIPLTLLFSLIAVTAIAWAFTLYQPFAMSASIGSGMGEMQGMAMEGMAMNSMVVLHRAPRLRDCLDHYDGCDDAAGRDADDPDLCCGSSAA
jgi:predicted metal-binding membrane protein